MTNQITLADGQTIQLRHHQENEEHTILIETPSIIAGFDLERLPAVCAALMTGQTIYASSSVPPVSSVSREGDELVLEYFEFEPFVQRYHLTAAEWSELGQRLTAIQSAVVPVMQEQQQGETQMGD